MPYRNYSPAAADARDLWRRLLDRPQLYPRDPEFSSLIRTVADGLRELCGSPAKVLLLTSPGTGALECALAALPSDTRVLVVRNGHFGDRLHQIARRHFAAVSAYDIPFGKALTPDNEADLSRAAGESRAGALVCVHLETSSTVINDVAAAGRAARETGALLLVDGVSSAGAAPVTLDAWGADAFVASGYKALLCPAGLSFILASERYLSAATRKWSYSYDLPRLASAADRGQFLWVPNVLNLYALEAALERILGAGQEAYFRDLEARSARLRQALRDGGLEVFGDPARLSPCFTAVKLREPNADLWLSRLKADHGLVLGKGIGEGADWYLRIGHYPHRSGEEVEEVGREVGRMKDEG
ncbi:MAG: alanine--glyoxylate aminotransferase family protein [Candidatus Zixiibacteriota bacterium]|nr:MAG: alanine--glyoxylate aminotransferase family protein [candidate division Zixibacteria bacterium]